MRRFLLACTADLLFGFLWILRLCRVRAWENGALLIQAFIESENGTGNCLSHF